MEINNMGYSIRTPYRRDDTLQIRSMKARFPNFKTYKEKRDLVFKGTLKVDPSFPVYTVKIIYRGNDMPLVSIISPKLKPNAPHRYKGGYLCLYHPNVFHWNGQKLIAKEIITWTAAWIYFYECWKQTGEWYGPEIPHKVKSKKQ